MTNKILQFLGIRREEQYKAVNLFFYQFSARHQSAPINYLHLSGMFFRFSLFRFTQMPFGSH